MKRVLFLGDSITDINIYPAIIETILVINEINDYEIFNIGLSSENLSGITEELHKFPRPNLNDRLDKAMQIIKPNIVFCLYGVNDGIYKPFNELYFSAFKKGYKQVIDTLNKYNVEINLCTTTYFDEKSCRSVLFSDGEEGEIYKDYDKVMQKYSDYIKSELKCNQIIDVYSAMKNYIINRQKTEKYDSGDGIHPNNEVAFIIADCFLKTYFKVDNALKIKDNNIYNNLYKSLKGHSKLKHNYYKELIGHKLPYKKVKPTKLVLKVSEKIKFYKLKYFNKLLKSNINN